MVLLPLTQFRLTHRCKVQVGARTTKYFSIPKKFLPQRNLTSKEKGCNLFLDVFVSYVQGIWGVQKFLTQKQTFTWLQQYVLCRSLPMDGLQTVADKKWSCLSGNRGWSTFTTHVLALAHWQLELGLEASVYLYSSEWSPPAYLKGTASLKRIQAGSTQIIWRGQFPGRLAYSAHARRKVFPMAELWIWGRAQRWTGLLFMALAKHIFKNFPGIWKDLWRIIFVADFMLIDFVEVIPVGKLLIKMFTLLKSLDNYYEAWKCFGKIGSPHFSDY